MSDLPEKVSQLCFVEMTIGAYAATEIEAKGTNLAHRFLHIVGSESTGEVHGNSQGLANGAADRPVVNPACAAEFFDSKAGIARIQQDSMDIGSNRASLIQRFGTADMDYLDKTNARKGSTQTSMATWRKRIDQLNCVHMAALLLLDNGVNVLAAGKEKGSNTRWDSMRNLCNLLF